MAMQTSPNAGAKKTLEKKEKNLAVITATGVDNTGLVAGISRVLAENKVNIEDLSQTTMNGLFAMMLLVDTSKSPLAFEKLREKIVSEGKKIGLEVTMQHKKIFEYMHRI